MGVYWQHFGEYGPCHNRNWSYQSYFQVVSLKHVFFCLFFHLSTKLTTLSQSLVIWFLRSKVLAILYHTICHHYSGITALNMFSSTFTWLSMFQIIFYKPDDNIPNSWYNKGYQHREVWLVFSCCNGNFPPLLNVLKLRHKMQVSRQFLVHADACQLPLHYHLNLQ